MRREHDLYAQNVGDSYLYLLQIRDGKIYTGDGKLVDLFVGPGSSETVGTSPGSGVTAPPTGSSSQITIEENITEEVILSSNTEYLLMLSDPPLINRPMSVVWNGLHLRKGPTYDYTVSDNFITINPEHQLEAGDLFTITYWKLSYI